MTTILNKRILLSLGMIIFVAVGAIGATGAFFSDTETSTGNTFTAGAIDLKVDSQQHYNGNECINGLWVGTSAYPVAGSECGGTWTETDLGITNKFFNFADIKPGDKGENTISLHVLNNDAYVCATVSGLTNDDNTQTEPESTVDTNGLTTGELQNTMEWTVWKDDGAGDGIACDNIQQTGEPTLTSGHPTNGTLALYDPSTGALTGDHTSCLGVSWSLPAESGNETQTDSMTGDISFTVVQSRNNDDFRCGQSQTPAPQWVETTQTEGDASFIDEAGRGNVLQLITIDDNNSRVRYTNSNLNIALSALTGISYESKQISAVDAVNGNATMRLSIDLDGDISTADAVEVTYEPYYNYTSQNPSSSNTSIVTGSWQTWNTTLANGKFWANGGFLGSTPNGGAYATNFTLQQVMTANPSAKIVGISLGMGTWNRGQVVLVDNLIINGANVDLEN